MLRSKRVGVGVVLSEKHVRKMFLASYALFDVNVMSVMLYFGSLIDAEE